MAIIQKDDYIFEGEKSLFKYEKFKHNEINYEGKGMDDKIQTTYFKINKNHNCPFCGKELIESLEFDEVACQNIDCQFNKNIKQLQDDMFNNSEVFKKLFKRE